jgi:hypothetical protein
MRPAYCVLFLLLINASCVNPFHKTIRGDGNITTSQRNISSAQNIKCSGSYDVQLTQGSPVSLKIEADQNLQDYIVTDVNGDELVIHTKDDINIDPTQKVKVYITADKLERFQLNGSGNVTTTNKFTGGDHLDLGIAGSGNIHFDVNTPQINSSISGTGDIYISGETRDSKINIAGSGNYHADDLKSENARVDIAGTGDAHLFADSTLDIHIAGVGNVYYKGNASITQSIAGTGKIKKEE